MPCPPLPHALPGQCRVGVMMLGGAWARSWWSRTSGATEDTESRFWHPSCSSISTSGRMWSATLTACSAERSAGGAAWSPVARPPEGSSAWLARLVRLHSGARLSVVIRARALDGVTRTGLAERGGRPASMRGEVDGDFVACAVPGLLPAVPGRRAPGGEEPRLTAAPDLRMEEPWRSTGSMLPGFAFGARSPGSARSAVKLYEPSCLNVAEFCAATGQQTKYWEQPGVSGAVRSAAGQGACTKKRC